MANETIQGGQTTAIVLPFPTPRPLTEQQRLQRAMAELQLALSEQAAAVVAWRGALANLDGSVARLAGSAQQYRTTLGEAADQVERLGRESRALVARLNG